MGLTLPSCRSRSSAVTGNGMHTKLSISKEGKNLFWDPKGEEQLSKLGWSFVTRI